MDLLGGAGNIPLIMTVFDSELPIGALLSMMFSPVVVDTSWCIFPVPYNFNFNVAKNATLSIANNTQFALMPGARVTVEQGGNLIVKAGSELYVLDNMEDSEFFRNEAGLMPLFNKIWNTQALGEISYDSDSGVYQLGSLGMLGTLFGVESPILASVKLSLARKFYPSKKLLRDNSFDTCAMLTVAGSLTVERRASLGGAVHAMDSATINLNSGAGTGALINYGGPYDTSGMFYKLAYQGNEVPFDLLTTVYIPCYLSIVNSEGKEVDLSSSMESTVGVSKKATFTGTEFENKTQLNATFKDGTVTIAFSGGRVTENLTISGNELKGATKEYVADDTVAYFVYDIETNALTLTDNKSTVEE